MINKEQMQRITEWIKDNVWRNDRVMYCMDDDTKSDLIDIVTSLHNLLYEAVCGDRYNYAFHWANKIGCWVEDNFFDEIIKNIPENDTK